MPRSARLHAVGDFHHVMSHGIDSLNLFENDSDCQVFKNILDENLKKYDCSCYAFALMDNHYHLLLRPSNNDFSKMMRKINTSYAKYINKIRNRRGYVFWDRFKSIPTRDLNYVRTLVLYIHRNPIRSGVINKYKDLKNYKRTSHSYLVNNNKHPEWFKKDFVKSLFAFGNDNKNPIKKYLNELEKFQTEEDSDSEKFDAWSSDAGHELPKPLIPSEVFSKEANWIMKKIKEANAKRQMQNVLIKTPRILTNMLKECCKKMDIPYESFEKNLHHSNRDICKVIKLFSYWSIEKVGFSGVMTGKILKRSGGSMLRLASLGESLAKEFEFPFSVNLT